MLPAHPCGSASFLIPRTKSSGVIDQGLHLTPFREPSSRGGRHGHESKGEAAKARRHSPAPSEALRVDSSRRVDHPLTRVETVTAVANGPRPNDTVPSCKAGTCRETSTASSSLDRAVPPRCTLGHSLARHLSTKRCYERVFRRHIAAAQTWALLPVRRQRRRPNA